MRFRITASSSLSLLLLCAGAATAQQRSMTCVERAQQIKTAQDQLAEVASRAAVEAVNCKTATDNRRRPACSVYADALILKDARTRQLEALMAAPGWRECPASADGTRYAPASVRPGSPATAEQSPPATGWQDAPGTSGSAGSGAAGSGPASGNSSPGSGSPAGSGGTSSPNTQVADCGSPGCLSSIPKVNHRHHVTTQKTNQPTKANQHHYRATNRNAGSHPGHVHVSGPAPSHANRPHVGQSGAAQRVGFAGRFNLQRRFR
jgi:hypothetical protein